MLVGHGSHINASSSAPVHECAAQLRQSGLFDEVVSAFWKEEPSLRDVLDLIESRTVFVVPLFLAEGYFTKKVVPRELGIEGRVTRRGHRTVHYCDPVGAHPEMERMIIERALAIRPPESAPPGETALVIIGHGTPLSPTSGDSVHRLTDRIRMSGRFGRVECGFLDQNPRIPLVLQRVRNREIILVPFFVAEGWHTSVTIPRDLGLEGSRTTRRGQTLWYAEPVGTMREIANVVVAIARDAGAFEDPSPGEAAPTTPRHDSEGRAGVSRGPREAFLERVGAAGPHGLEVLELLISAVGPNRFDVRHRNDRAADASSLVPVAAPGDALEIARYDAAGRFRPLRTAATLRDGWILAGLDSGNLWDALSLFYPGAVQHHYASLGGALETVPFRSWAGRQSGAYAGVGAVQPGVLEQVIENCCGGCLRTRVWEYDSVRSQPIERDPFIVPCREPCTFFGSVVRDAVGLIEPASASL